MAQKLNFTWCEKGLNLFLLISSYFWLIWQRWTPLYRMGAQRYGFASLHWLLTLIPTSFFENSPSNYILQRFRGVGKRALQKLKNGLVRYQLKIGFQLRILKGETYVNFKNFVGPVFMPKKRCICHFYSFAYFCQICIVN